MKFDDFAVQLHFNRSPRSEGVVRRDFYSFQSFHEIFDFWSRVPRKVPGKFRENPLKSSKIIKIHDNLREIWSDQGDDLLCTLVFEIRFFLRFPFDKWL